MPPRVPVKAFIVVMVSHDLNIAAKYADRLIMMSPLGVVFAEGPPDLVLTERNIEEVYVVKCHVVMDEGRPHVILRSPATSFLDRRSSQFGYARMQ